MAKIDYAKTALKVQKVIEENGTTVTFIRRSETASDPAKPWRTYDSTLTGTAGTPGSTVSGLGIRDEYNQEELEDNLYIRHRDYMILVSPKSIQGVDLTLYDSVEFDGQVAEIKQVETIKPAAVTLLYILHVRR